MNNVSAKVIAAAKLRRILHAAKYFRNYLSYFKVTIIFMIYAAPTLSLAIVKYL